MFTLREALHAAQSVYMPTFKQLAGQHGAAQVEDHYLKEWHMAALGLLVLKIRALEEELKALKSQIQETKPAGVMASKRQVTRIDESQPLCQTPSKNH